MILRFSLVISGVFDSFRRVTLVHGRISLSSAASLIIIQSKPVMLGSIPEKKGGERV